MWVFGGGDDWFYRTAASETASASNTKVEIFVALLIQVINKTGAKTLIHMKKTTEYLNHPCQKTAARRTRAQHPGRMMNDTSL